MEMLHLHVALRAWTGMARGSTFSFLLLSGGVGRRTELSYPKQFHLINGHPMLAYAIIAAIQVDEIDEIIVNCPPGFEEQTENILEAYAASKDHMIVPTGATRQESTRILVENARNDHVILHEAARPVISPDKIVSLIRTERPNVSYCQPIHFSMCSVDPQSHKLLARVDRDTTMNIQLPQKFARTHLAKAHEEARRRRLIYTEDAMLCAEVGGFDVFFEPGWNTNIKITTGDDFRFAESVLQGYRIDE